MGVEGLRAITVAGWLLMASAAAMGEDLWALYQPACGASGIDPDPCLCILDEVVKVHGEEAARYVGLEMVLRYDEAAAIRDRIGEDKAFAASSLFDTALNLNCSSGRLARLKGIYTGAPTGASIASETAVARDAPTGLPVEVPATEGVVHADAPVLDLRAYPAGLLVDVEAALTREALASLATGDLRRFISFYPVIDTQGRVDSNGDGRADMAPGDPGYTAYVQGPGSVKKLYLSANAGQEQYLGDVRLAGGFMYALYLRFDSKRPATVSPLDLPTDSKDPQALMDFLRQGMSNPSHLYFVFDRANPDGASHLRHLGNGEFGFEEAPEAADQDFNDVVISLSFSA